MEHDGFFNYGNYFALVTELGARAKAGNPEAREDTAYVTEHFQNFFAYVSAVCNSEVGIHLASGSLEGSAKQNRITELDRMRSKYHDAAIASAAADMINLLIISSFQQVWKVSCQSGRERRLRLRQQAYNRS